jgi:hypothetical protein
MEAGAWPGKQGSKTREKNVEKSGEKVENAGNEAETERKTARDLTKTDWMTIRYLIAVEHTPIKIAAKRFGIDPTTIRTRIRNEGWRDPKRAGETPALEELIVMRNQKEILDALGNMSGKLEVAMQSKNQAEVELAMKKAELVGKTARSTQSVARAADMSAATGRKIKANAKQPANAAQDRAAIKAELDRIAAKTPA